MNTVGKEGRLGQSIRCVVSVSMLTEGWDANTVTHVLGVRAFGTQLLLRASGWPRLASPVLRPERRGSVRRGVRRRARRSLRFYSQTGRREACAASPNGTGQSSPAQPRPPRNPVPQGVRLPHRPAQGRPYAADVHRRLIPSELTPDLVGPSTTRNEGIIGEGVDLNLVHTGDLRRSTLLFHLTQRLLYTKWRDPNEDPKLHLFGRLKAIVRQWLDDYLVCKGRDLSCSAHVPGVGGQSMRDHHGRHHQQSLGRVSRQGPARSLQPDRLDRARELHNVQD